LKKTDYNSGSTSEHSYKDLWSPVLRALGKEVEVGDDDWPRGNLIRKIFSDRKVVILIDKIDTWFDAKPDQEKARIEPCKRDTYHSTPEYH
jgi:hypothetical protein